MAGSARWQAGRTTAVLVVLLGGLAAAAAFGANLLFTDIPAKGPDPVSVTCWDGEQRTDPGDCGQPTGVRGLRWVFPSFRPGDEDCRDVRDEHPEFRGPTMWACEVEISGSPVEITYRELLDVEQGLAAVQRSYGGVGRTTVEADDGSPLRYEWRRPIADGFVLTSAYAAHPYAVEVRAEVKSLREDALATIVRFRPPGAISYR